MVIGQDDSLVNADRADLYAALKVVDEQLRLTYEHLTAHAEPLLWIADAAAWCWTHGPTWQSRIRDRLGKLHVL